MNNYGLVTGVNGNIQFDTNRKTIGVWEHGSISSWSAIPTFDTPPFHGYVHEFNYNCNMVGIAVRPNTSTLVTGRVGKITDWNGTYIGGKGNIFVSAPTTVEYAIYSPDAESRIIPSWGLLTYDENQQIVFNSGLRHLKITEIIEVNRNPLVTIDNSYWPGPGTVTFSHNTPNPFYIIPNNYIEMTYTTWPGDGKMWVGLHAMVIGVQKISATSAKLERFTLRESGPGTPAGSGGFDYLKAFFDVPNPLRIAVCVL